MRATYLFGYPDRIQRWRHDDPDREIKMSGTRLRRYRELGRPDGASSPGSESELIERGILLTINGLATGLRNSG